MGTLIKLPVFGACTSSLSTMWTTSASTTNADETVENALSSTVLSATTSSMTCGPDKNVTINMAQQYIESLSEEQLVELSEKIEAKEQNFVMETSLNDDDIVVKVKTPNKKG